ACVRSGRVFAETTVRQYGFQCLSAVSNKGQLARHRAPAYAGPLRVSSPVTPPSLAEIGTAHPANFPHGHIWLHLFGGPRMYSRTGTFRCHLPPNGYDIPVRERFGGAIEIHT